MDSNSRCPRSTKKKKKARSPSMEDLGFESGSFSDGEGRETDYDAEVTEYQLNEIAPMVAPDMHSLALFLSVGHDEVKGIELDYPKSEQRSCEMLIKWKQRQGDAATVRNLSNALAKVKRADVIIKLTGNPEFAKQLVAKEIGSTEMMTLAVEKTVTSQKGLEERVVQDPATGKKYLLSELPPGDTPYLQDSELPHLIEQIQRTTHTRHTRNDHCKEYILKELSRDIHMIDQDQRKSVKEPISGSSLKHQGKCLSHIYDQLSEQCELVSDKKCISCYNQTLGILQNLFDRAQGCEIYFDVELKKLMSSHSQLSENVCQEVEALREMQDSRESLRQLVKQQLASLHCKDGMDGASSRNSTPPVLNRFSSMYQSMKDTISGTRRRCATFNKDYSCSTENCFTVSAVICSPIDGNDNWVLYSRESVDDNAEIVQEKEYSHRESTKF